MKRIRQAVTNKWGIVFAGVLCLLICGLVSSCSDYDHIQPSALGTVTIPKKQITISLLSKSRPQPGICPYEGEYRILEVSQRDKPTVYYDLTDTIPADQCRMEIFWYPTNNLIRLRDAALEPFAREFRSESILNLNENILYCAIRQGNQISHLAKLSVATNILAFPKSTEPSRSPHSYGGSVSDPNQTITIGEEEAKPINASWTNDSGILVGVIGKAPKLY